MLRRRARAVAVAAIAAGVMSSPAAFGALPTPVLGLKYAFKYGKGSGTVRPTWSTLEATRPAGSSRSPGTGGAVPGRWDMGEDGARASQSPPVTVAPPRF